MIIHPQHVLGGTITAPPSKSHTLRATLFATLADGISTIHAPLDSPDTTAMIQACRQFGTSIQVEADKLVVTGTAGKLQTPQQPIDAGNSGIVLRFMAGLASLLNSPIIVTGDHSIQTNRSIKALLNTLSRQGVSHQYQQTDGYAPVTITGPVHAGELRIDGQDSQPVSALLIACSQLTAPSTIEVSNLGEQPWLALTLDWFDRLNIGYRQLSPNTFQVAGNSRLQAFDYTVPGDFSSTLFPACAAILSQSITSINNLDWQDSQGDKLAFELLEQMGANIQFDKDTKCLNITPSGQLQAIQCSINDCIDALPMLAVMCCFANGTSILSHAAIARQKECDRLAVMAQALTSMGANIEETDDSLIIHGPSQLTGTSLYAQRDHRIAMALTIAALNATSPSTLSGTEWIRKTYANFYQDLATLGCAFPKKACTDAN